MVTKFEKTALAFLIVLFGVFYAMTIHSFSASYSAIINGEWVMMENGTVVADDYKVAEADADADFIEIVEKPEEASPVEEIADTKADTKEELNPYEEIAARTTDEEWELLRWIVALEAGDQGLEGEMMVIESIFNRVLSPKWTAPWGGDTIDAVLHGKHQYSTLKYVGSSKAWCTPGQLEDDAIAETIRRGPSLLPSTKYVYFDSKGGVNGFDTIRYKGHYFSREK